MKTTIADLNIQDEIRQETDGSEDWSQETVRREISSGARPLSQSYGQIQNKPFGRLHFLRPVRRCLRVWCAYQSRKDMPSCCGPRTIGCIGPACAETADNCVSRCPQKALALRLNPNTDCLGDPRWSSDLILSTWYEAETGAYPAASPGISLWRIGGGFDRIRFKFEIPGFGGPVRFRNCGKKKGLEGGGSC